MPRFLTPAILAACLATTFSLAQTQTSAPSTPNPYPTDPANGSTKPTPASNGDTVSVPAPPNAAADAKAEEAEKPKLVRISGGVMAGQLLHKVAPVVPTGTACHVKSDAVVLKAIIGKDGNVKELSIVSGAEALQRPYMDAVKQWRYKPYLLNGEPVEVETTIMISGNRNSHGC